MHALGHDRRRSATASFRKLVRLMHVEHTSHSGCRPLRSDARSPALCSAPAMICAAGSMRMRTLALLLLLLTCLNCTLPEVWGAAAPARPSPLRRAKSWEEAWAALSPYQLSPVAAAACNSSSGPTFAASCGVSECWSTGRMYEPTACRCSKPASEQLAVARLAACGPLVLLRVRPLLIT